MKKFFKENRKGFTLIELLVVISILAVLATLYVPKIISGTDNAKETVAIADARTLASEITQKNVYATTGSGSVWVPTPAAQALKPSQIDGGTHSDDSVVDYTAGKRVVTQTNLTAGYSSLLDGRKFPNAEYVLIIVDSNGSAYICKPDGSAF